MTKLLQRLDRWLKWYRDKPYLKNKRFFQGSLTGLHLLLRLPDETVLWDILVLFRSLTLSLKLSARHPMILPSKHHVTDLVIRDCHGREGHVGAGQVLASVRQNFWILRGHAAVRRVIGECLKCRFWNARPCEQIMAPLPSKSQSLSFPLLFRGRGLLRYWSSRGAVRSRDTDV